MLLTLVYIMLHLRFLAGIHRPDPADPDDKITMKLLVRLSDQQLKQKFDHKKSPKKHDSEDPG